MLFWKRFQCFHDMSLAQFSWEINPQFSYFEKYRSFNNLVSLFLYILPIPRKFTSKVWEMVKIQAHFAHVFQETEEFRCPVEQHYRDIVGVTCGRPPGKGCVFTEKSQVLASLTCRACKAPLRGWHKNIPRLAAGDWLFLRLPVEFAAFSLKKCIIPRLAAQCH